MAIDSVTQTAFTPLADTGTETTENDQVRAALDHTMMVMYYRQLGAMVLDFGSEYKRIVEEFNPELSGQPPKKYGEEFGT